MIQSLWQWACADHGNDPFTRDVPRPPGVRVLSTLARLFSSPVGRARRPLVARLQDTYRGMRLCRRKSNCRKKSGEEGRRSAQGNIVKPTEVEDCQRGLPESRQEHRAVNNSQKGRVESLPRIHPLMGSARDRRRRRRGVMENSLARRICPVFRQVVGVAQGRPAAHPQARKCQEKRDTVQSELCRPSTGCHLEGHSTTTQTKRQLIFAPCRRHVVRSVGLACAGRVHNVLCADFPKYLSLIASALHGGMGCGTHLYKSC